MRAIRNRERVRVRVGVRVREEGRRLGEEVHLLRAADEEVEITELRESPATTVVPESQNQRSQLAAALARTHARRQRGNR